MARNADPASRDQVLRAVRARPDGATIEQLVTALGHLPRRTLQRHLAKLVTERRVRAEGRGNQRRYRIATTEPDRPEELVVSPAGAEVRALVGEARTW